MSEKDTNNVGRTLTEDLVRAARDSLTENGKPIHMSDEDILAMSDADLKVSLARLERILRSLPRNT